jgi:hypothetical protein
VVRDERAPHLCLVAGGGVAAVELMLAVRDLAEEVDIAALAGRT